jgi:hypothetical protein
VTTSVPLEPLADIETLGGDRIPAELRGELSRLVAEARERQRKEVELAIDTALSHIPAVLRGAVRKLLFR